MKLDSDHILREKRDPEFDQRVLRLIEWRLRTNHRRATLSPWDASSILCWLKHVADERSGKKLSFQEFQNAITDETQETWDQCELFINDHMRFAEISRAEVFINDIHRGTVFQNGFPLPCRRGLKFETARTYISNALKQGWFNLRHDKTAGDDPHLQLMNVLAHIREDEIAYTVLNQWVEKKRVKKNKNISIPKSVWEIDIRNAERIVFNKLLSSALTYAKQDVQSILDMARNGERSNVLKDADTQQFPLVRAN